MRTKAKGQGGPRVIMVLHSARFCFPGPEFRGDPNCATSEDEGVIVIEPGTPIQIDLQFNYPGDVRAASTKFLRDANPLPTFIADCCEKDARGRVLMQRFYEAYVEWAKAMGITMLQQQLNVRRNLEHLKYHVGRSNKGQIIMGLRLKTAFSQDG